MDLQRAKSRVRGDVPSQCRSSAGLGCWRERWSVTARPAPDSANTALRNASFRAYADHMIVAEYQAALARLIAHSNERGTAIMCAERLPWHCHRHLISDSLVARGVTVLHIVSEAPPRAHAMSPLARVEGAALVYDRGSVPELDLDGQAPARVKRRSTS